MKLRTSHLQILNILHAAATEQAGPMPDDTTFKTIPWSSNRLVISSAHTIRTYYLKVNREHNPVHSIFKASS